MLSARERILEVAFRLFYANGIRAVGVDTVIAESGVAKATLYKHFASKDELVLAYLEKADRAWREKLEAAADDAGEDPRAQLVGLFDAVVSTCRSQSYHGCPFINTAAEAVQGSAAHARTIEHKRAVRAWIRSLAQSAGARDPDALALSLTLLLDGALAAGVLDADPGVAASAKDAARRLVDDSLSHSREETNA